jgi:myo-inositol 2-dehydrogenase / D-chiro-inositol 1-dehydrogenase
VAGELRLGVVGVGRIGVFHAQHVQEIANERGDCALSAVVDAHQDTAERVAARLQPGQDRPTRAFRRVADAIDAGLIEAAVVASRTEDHEAHARILVDAGCRVLLEKPLAGSVERACALAEHLAATPAGARAVMQAFQRRFDEPLRLAKQLVDRGAVGRPFKVVSVLEDPGPPPDGYQSPGLLFDMAVHNVDEVLWLLGQRPDRVAATGNRLHNVQVASVHEDFDDAQLGIWFPDGAAAQVQVSRNHVAGYRNETWVYGQRGHVHVGAFQEDPLRVDVEAFGRDGVIARESFQMRRYATGVPVFIERYGPAYRAEVAHFVDRAVRGLPFAVTHEDGLVALRIVAAATASIRTREDATPLLA